MTNHAHQLLKEALQLSPAERVELLDQILASLDSDYRERIEAEWAIEIEDRIAALDKGEMPTLPAEDVYDRYRDRWRK